MRRTKRKAWVITIDPPRALDQNEARCIVEPGEPLVVLPSRTPVNVVKTVVDALNQLINHCPSDMERYLTRKGAPDAAQVIAWGQQVTGGSSPYYIEAFKVDDLQVVTNSSSGEESFSFTRKRYTRPDDTFRQDQ